ncbi:MAG: galactokinase [Planctomycetota bacterium]
MTPREHDQGLAARAFVERFGRPPAIVAIAPGRVNLIGEHTDYSDGFVFPIAIDRHCTVALGPAEGDRTTLFAADLDDSAEVPAGSIEPNDPAVPQGSWPSYVLGAMTLTAEAIGEPVRAVNALLTSTVPAGGGLSSSAAIEVASSVAYQALANVSLPPMETAQICQRAEHAYAGVPCGIMDQFASAHGQRDHALLLDCRSLEHRSVAMPSADTLSIAVINTNVKHSLAGGEYAARRAEVERAAEILGVLSLRDASPEQVASAGDALGEPIARRARHVVTENERTHQAAAALESGDLVEFGRLLLASHASLRDDFEVSCDELDFVVDHASRAGGVVGARMTGGGFGGCAIAAGPPDALESMRRAIEPAYHERFGRACAVFLVTAGEGASAGPALPSHA